ncbi:hypothetical protein CR983_02320 [Candidatus Saccharibacteria bacterium]|nr:MAG: hypothetical protein CR983_02320 [Candidatus Saccharibacteria bacterium]
MKTMKLTEYYSPDGIDPLYYVDVPGPGGWFGSVQIDGAGRYDDEAVHAVPRPRQNQERSVARWCGTECSLASVAIKDDVAGKDVFDSLPKQSHHLDPAGFLGLVGKNTSWSDVNQAPHHKRT